MMHFYQDHPTLLFHKELPSIGNKQDDYTPSPRIHACSRCARAGGSGTGCTGGEGEVAEPDRFDGFSCTGPTGTKRCWWCHGGLLLEGLMHTVSRGITIILSVLDFGSLLSETQVPI